MKPCPKCGHREIDISDLYYFWFGDSCDNTKSGTDDAGLGWVGLVILIVISAVCLCLLNWYIYLS